jgi:DNA adenine methylase
MQSSSSDFRSPLRYPGGKGKVVGFFVDLLRANRLYDIHYVEPYAGGASVALALLFGEFASRIHINDVDPAVHAFWHSVLHEPDALCQKIRDTKISVKEWDRQRSIQKHQSDHDTLEVGFSTFFMNRTNRSGIITAGIIGGRNQTGDWKIDARFNKSDLIARIERIAYEADRITLTRLDAVELIKRSRKELPTNTLFYCDPPYFVKGQALYLNHYNEDDHASIANEMALVNQQRWVMTYDDAPQIRELYRKFRTFDFALMYSATQPKIGHEILVLSDNLHMTDKPIISSKRKVLPTLQAPPL